MKAIFKRIIEKKQSQVIAIFGREGRKKFLLDANESYRKQEYVSDLCISYFEENAFLMKIGFKIKLTFE